MRDNVTFDSLDKFAPAEITFECLITLLSEKLD